jgi:hypothetical protein
VRDPFGGLDQSGYLWVDVKKILLLTARCPIGPFDLPRIRRQFDCDYYTIKAVFLWYNRPASAAAPKGARKGQKA